MARNASSGIASSLTLVSCMHRTSGPIASSQASTLSRRAFSESTFPVARRIGSSLARWHAAAVGWSNHLEDLMSRDSDRLRDAFASRQLDRLIDLMDPDVTWRGIRVPGEETPICHNRDEVRE